MWARLGGRRSWAQAWEQGWLGRCRLLLPQQMCVNQSIQSCFDMQAQPKAAHPAADRSTQHGGFDSGQTAHLQGLPRIADGPDCKSEHIRSVRSEPGVSASAPLGGRAPLKLQACLSRLRQIYNIREAIWVR